MMDVTAHRLVTVSQIHVQHPICVPQPVLEPAHTTTTVDAQVTPSVIPDSALRLPTLANLHAIRARDQAHTVSDVTVKAPACVLLEHAQIMLAHLHVLLQAPLPMTTLAHVTLTPIAPQATAHRQTSAPTPVQPARALDHTMTDATAHRPATVSQTHVQHPICVPQTAPPLHSSTPVAAPATPSVLLGTVPMQIPANPHAT